MLSLSSQINVVNIKAADRNYYDLMDSTSPHRTVSYLSIICPFSHTFFLMKYPFSLLEEAKELISSS